MKRKLLLAALTGGMILVPASAAIAHPGHTGCGEFGEHLAGEAQSLRPLGGLVSQVTPLNTIIAAEHTALCD
jgi:hypothetical protein